MNIWYNILPSYISINFVSHQIDFQVTEMENEKMGIKWINRKQRRLENRKWCCQKKMESWLRLMVKDKTKCIFLFSFGRERRYETARTKQARDRKRPLSLVLRKEWSQNFENKSFKCSHKVPIFVNRPCKWILVNSLFDRITDRAITSVGILTLSNLGELRTKFKVHGAK